MVVKVIIFDFDGTIADTYNAFVEIVNDLSKEFGYKPLTPEDLARLKKLSSREIVQQSEISLIQIPFLLKRVKTELSKIISDLSIFSGLKSCLIQLHKKGYILGIVTSNDQANVQCFLENNQLDSLFDFVYSGTNLFGKHKVINQIIKKYNFSRDEIVYVGDETRDIQSAKASHIKVIAVGWGFNDPEALAKYEPDALINYPYQLIGAVECCNDDCLEMLLVDG
ncbi:HAD-IA family hydrolase [Gloeothece verrucosa]|uniref:Haloacid dehalogenase domain protein hydrolase n=1 Tax=Gloeothece verrucosa (strain PCC 7822) TaxID=497965 RepID=E0UC70_GLOV7|nr:HAD-IA family hydrolase [Gloeothece verrucosa]ADN16408.1 Haloacid dehalogenase domain protein hydrolase [Gloeothece verrucosa PCC 7822]